VTAKWDANHQKISPRRFKQLYAKYKTTNATPTVGLNVGKPKKQITPKTVKIIKQVYEKDQLSAQYLIENIVKRIVLWSMVARRNVGFCM